jgi:hypothetical protein
LPERLNLPDVTLCAVTSVAIPETVRALERSMAQVEFGAVLLLSHERVGHDRIEWRQIDPVRSQEEYSEFLLRRLAEHIQTPHVLVSQWDSWVIDAERWDPGFLDYDYIGATWPQFDDGHEVGNGGFSLRSRRLLDLTAAPDFPGHHPEDVSICRTYRELLEGRGIRFAPTSVAERFSFERGRQIKSFGFHGLFNFPRVLPRTELISTLRDLGTDRFSGRDGADLIVELARRGMRREAWSYAIRRRADDRSGWRNLRFWSRLIAATLR